MRKILQIAMANPNEDSAESSVVALCDDATVWHISTKIPTWRMLPPIPQGFAEYPPKVDYNPLD